jgi:predicted acyl esterase
LTQRAVHVRVRRDVELGRTRVVGPCRAVGALDGFEVFEWVVDQPWSDGRTGGYGASYLGLTQIFSAAQQPEGLEAIFPIVRGSTETVLRVRRLGHDRREGARRVGQLDVGVQGHPIRHLDRHFPVRGYAQVTVDLRGTGTSEGGWDPFSERERLTPR